MEDQSNYRSDGENAPEFNMPKQVQHNNDEPIKRMDAHQYEKTIQDLLEKKFKEAGYDFDLDDAT